MKIENLTKIGATPVMNETNVFPDILKEHMTPRGKWGNVVVVSGELDFQWLDSNEVVTVTPESSLLIEPERLHRVVLTGPVNFKVEFYKAEEESEEATQGVLRPGENFLDK